jgi:hypothetical protein
MNACALLARDRSVLFNLPLLSLIPACPDSVPRQGAMHVLSACEHKLNFSVVPTVPAVCGARYRIPFNHAYPAALIALAESVENNARGLPANGMI